MARIFVFWPMLDEIAAVACVRTRRLYVNLAASGNLIVLRFDL